MNNLARISVERKKSILVDNTEKKKIKRSNKILISTRFPIIIILYIEREKCRFSPRQKFSFIVYLCIQYPPIGKHKERKNI